VHAAQGEVTPRHIEGRGDGSRRLVDRWALRWCEYFMCGRLNDRNSAGDDTQARSRGGFVGESPDRWVPAASVMGAEIGGRPGSLAEMGHGAVEAGRRGGKRPAKLFPF
jgi:hypothetical protein